MQFASLPLWLASMVVAWFSLHFVCLRRAGDDVSSLGACGLAFHVCGSVCLLFFLFLMLFLCKCLFMFSGLHGFNATIAVVVICSPGHSSLFLWPAFWSECCLSLHVLLVFIHRCPFVFFACCHLSVLVASLFCFQCRSCV